jgi:tripartite-type tricarboxylate transporter receptor subunit TctC
VKLLRILATLVFGALLAQAGPASAEAPTNWPQRPVRIVIGFGPGSGTDILARMIAEELRVALGQPFIVDNRPGASAQIAASAVAKAEPDGYTLFLTSNSSHSVNPHVFKKLPYDPIADFTPIGGIAYFPFILAVNAQLPIHTAQEFVSYARAHRGHFNYAYGTPTVQIPAEALNRLLDLKAIAVPYKSSPAALNDVIGGQAQFLVVDLASAKPQLQAGRLRALAVTTSKRTALAPELPTIEETLGLKDFDLAAWTGLFGPAHLPKEIVAKLNAEIRTALNAPAVRERFKALGADIDPSSPEDFLALSRRESVKWARIIKLSGARID